MSPLLHIDDELKSAADSVLRNDESLSEFVEAALRESIARRCMQAAFSAQGLAAREQGRCNEDSFEADEVTTERNRGKTFGE